MSKTTGKIDQEIADVLFRNCGYSREEVSIGPSFGVDVSVVNLPGGLGLISTSDPLSLIPSLGLEESAWLSVHLMANDMATTGFAPMYGQFVLNLPAHLSREDLKIYWEYVGKFCREVGISITGGHTGFIEGQHSTIAGGGTLFTVAPREKILVSKNARESEVLLVTKQCAISSTAILAMSFPQTITNSLGKEIAETGRTLFYQTSSLKDALTAVGKDNASLEVTAMHDVTEGGVLGAIYEMVTASGKGALIDDDALPIGEAQQRIGELFGIDPRYTIGAGAMLICCKKEAEERVIGRLRKEQIDCARIGEIKPADYGIKLATRGRVVELEYLAEDPYWTAFFKALKKGWK